MEIKIKRLSPIGNGKRPNSYIPGMWELEYISDAPYQGNGRRDLSVRWSTKNLCQDGVLRLLYASGELRAEITSWNYQRHGISRWYYESGILEAEIYYENGLRHGKASWFSHSELRARTYYYRGFEVSAGEYHILQNGSIGIKDVLGLQNVELRRVLLGEFGAERLFNEVPHIVLDEDGYEMLVQIEVDKERINIVKVKCTSTDRFYLLRVPPEIKRIHEGKAWTFGLTEEEYHPTKET